jgi:hypothetical protein
MKVRGSRVSVVSFLLQHVRLLEPFLVTQLVSLGGCLHTDLLQDSVVVLDVLVGSEGCVKSVLQLHVLLGLVPLSGHLVELVLGLDLEKVDTVDGGQHVLGVLLGLVCLLYSVLLVKPVLDLDFVKLVTGNVGHHVLSTQLRLGVLLASVLLVNLHVELVGGLGYEGSVVGNGGQRVLSVVQRLCVPLNSVLLANLLCNLVLDDL